MPRSTIADADPRSDALVFMQDVLPFVAKRLAPDMRTTPFAYDIDGNAGSVSWGRPADRLTLYATPFFDGSTALEWQWMDDEGRVLMTGTVDLNRDWIMSRPTDIARDYQRIVLALLAMRDVLDV